MFCASVQRNYVLDIAPTSSKIVTVKLTTKRSLHNTRLGGVERYNRKRFLELLNDAFPSPITELQELQGLGGDDISRNLGRVFEIISELNEGTRRKAQSRASGRVGSPWKHIWFEGKDHISAGWETYADELEYELNERMKQYHKQWPCFRRAGGELLVGWHHEQGHEFIRMLRQAADAGDISNLVRCDWKKCSRWMFRRKREGTHCCKSAHRQAFNRSSPAGKKKQAAYMRKYRKNLKDEAEKALRRAKALRAR